ncbi:hypothetical protein [Streptomyces sp. BK239]|uniref:hypothetical protein n=1 Tax=Streptomyces sp. BK239 TaxID=2512155 RepID=UPI003241BFBC
MTGGACGAGAVDGRGDELPCGRGEAEADGEADAEADADGEGLPADADAEGDPLAEGVAKEISPEVVSLSDVVRP